jgi:carboxyl-terminal processing protease
MLKSLDPYTVFIPESDVEDFKMMQTGLYGGIGSTIRKIGDKIIISDLHQGFPADKAGLRPGDQILEVDGNSMTGKSTEEVSRVLKGTPGTTVKLTYEREGKTYTIDIKREEIQLKSVPYYGMIDENIGYIYLSSFTDKASKEIREAYEDLKQNNSKLSGIILDLRNNPGGLLNEAVNVTNIFVDKGQEVVSTKGRIQEMEKTYHTLKSAVDTEIPIAILINKGSASASEIVAGTIQDLDRGVVIGQRSFGKGLVQQSHPLQYGSQIKITIAKYYTPSGRCIQAINYAEKDEDGSVIRVPDSLRTEFKTKNGRSVYDGGGVDPDINIADENASGILISLVNNSLIFDYATVYVNKHPELASPGSFKLTDAEYQDFVNYLKDKKYEYLTETEEMISELKKTAEREQYSDLTEDLARIESKSKQIKGDDLMRHKTQIVSYLEQEITGRYYYQAGKIRQGLEGDPLINSALNVLKNKEEYNKILTLAK